MGTGRDGPVRRGHPTVDLTVLGQGRNVPRVARIPRATSLNVVGAGV